MLMNALAGEQVQFLHALNAKRMLVFFVICSFANKCWFLLSKGYTCREEPHTAAVLMIIAYPRFH